MNKLEMRCEDCNRECSVSDRSAELECPNCGGVVVQCFPQKDCTTCESPLPLVSNDWTNKGFCSSLCLLEGASESSHTDYRTDSLASARGGATMGLWGLGLTTISLIIGLISYQVQFHRSEKFILDLACLLGVILGLILIVVGSLASRKGPHWRRPKSSIASRKQRKARKRPRPPA
jgi:predicted RNA-binding Zn-ribbon protein involved in translation (DUF1610 family)